DIAAFNQALCGLYAAGLGTGVADTPVLDHASPHYDGKPVEHAGCAVGITGAALGLPGTERIFDDANIARILRGEQFIDVIPTRLVKSDNGGPVFEHITSPADVIKLAGRGGAFDLEHEFGVPPDRLPAFDRVTELAIGAGIDALRDAGIPLVMSYKTTTKGTQL